MRRMKRKHLLISSTLEYGNRIELQNKIFKGMKRAEVYPKGLIL
jgi:hypothetical protein